MATTTVRECAQCAFWVRLLLFATRKAR